MEEAKEELGVLVNANNLHSFSNHLVDNKTFINGRIV